ncbi:MAG: TldD/PmbA family protein [Planctomycetota bacterium]|jgi:predicted Zn-dependent protease
MLEPDRAGRLADAALHHVDADGVEVVVEAVEEELNRFTADHPVQNILRGEACVSVRVQTGGRQGKASTGVLTEDAVRRTAQRALDVARRMPKPVDALPPLPGPQQFSLRGAEPEAVDPVATARAVGAVTEACRAASCAAAGILASTSTLMLVRNSAGLDVCDLDRHAEVSVSAFREDGAGWANRIADRREGLDTHAVASRAVEKTLASRAPQPVPPGHYTVILEPSAVSSLLLFTASHGFGAQQVMDGTSFLSGRLGEPVLGENITLEDDCHHPITVGPVFDGEGLPRSKVTLVERGVAKALVHDQITARRAGCSSTGHAQPQPSPSGPAPSNLVLAPGVGSTEDLVRDVERGILVTQFHYTNMVEPTALTLTGMTRNGTFLVEKGEVVGAVRNMRFTQSLVEALNRVSALGSDATLASALFGGYVVVPSLRIDGFGFSSGTDF